MIIGRKFGKYKVVELLGQGGMATVYKGYDEDVDRFVAIKVLPPHPGMTAQVVDRFRLEARVIARLQHPHILPIYDYGSEHSGENDGDILYLVMAYIEGGALEHHIERGPMPLKDIERILRQVSGALDYAHRQGVYHRDIKPGNILLDTEGNALISDFGIAKLANDSSNLTGTGIIGTPAYMAPEQARGSKEIDQRVDIYALGAVVFEMLTGRQPYTADTPLQVLLRQINDPVPSLFEYGSGLPVGLDTVITQAMAKDPADRFPTAAAFADEFSRICADTTGSGSLRISDVAASAPTVTGESPTEVMASTQALPNAAPTVIMQPVQTINPLLLIGGFALIAVAIIVAALIIVGLLTNNRPDLLFVPPPNATLFNELIVPLATPAAQTSTFGQLSFITTERRGDTLSLRVQDLEPVPDGQDYVAWLTSAAGDPLRVGTVRLDALNAGVLSYTDPEGRMLAAWYDTLIITLEDSGFTGDAPEGDPVYRATRPPELSTALHEVFVTSENGLPQETSQSDDDEYAAPGIDGPISLYDSLLVEAEIAAQHAGLAARASDLVGLRTHAEHTINILSGTMVDLDGNGRGENPGAGLGVYTLFERIWTTLSGGLSAPNVALSVQNDAELVRVCLQNVRGWSDEIVALETQFLAAADTESVADEREQSTATAALLLEGTDLNGNGRIEAFEGECGLAQIDDFGLLLASLDLVAVEGE